MLNNKNKSNKFTLVDVSVCLFLVAGISFFLLRMTIVLNYQWEWDAIPGYFIFKDTATGQFKANILLKGFLTTIKLSVWATMLGFLFGTISGIMGAGSSFFQRCISRFYVETIRKIDEFSGTGQHLHYKPDIYKTSPLNYLAKIIFFVHKMHHDTYDKMV